MVPPLTYLPSPYTASTCMFSVSDMRMSHYIPTHDRLSTPTPFARLHKYLDILPPRKDIELFTLFDVIEGC